MKRSTPGSSQRHDPSLGGVRLQLTPSQQRLLERLEYMASVDGPLIALCGLVGAGKTTLAVQLLDRSDGVNAALVTLAGAINDDDLHRQLSWQLAGEFEGDGQLPLAELCDAIAARGERLLMVIDGAQHLSSGQFDLLADAVRGSDLTPGSRVALLVVDRDGGPAPEWLADPLIAPLLIDALPESEQVALWRSRIGTAGDEYGDIEIGAWLGRVAPTISHLLRLADDGMVPGSRLGDNANHNRSTLLLLAIALLLLVGGWLLWPSSTPQQQTAMPEPIELPATPQEADLLVPQPDELVDEMPDEMPDDALFADADATGLDAERQARAALRVDVPASTVDEALAQSAMADVETVTDGVTIAVADPLLLDDAPSNASSNAQQVAEADAPLDIAPIDIAPAPKPEPKPVAKPEPKPEPKPAAKPEPKPAAAKAASKPAAKASAFHSPAGTAYTLQLAAMHSESGIRDFARKQLGNSGPWAVLRTTRDGRPWYLLIQGRYASAAAARQALPKLPEGARQYGAWPKPLAAIHEQGFSVVSSAP